MTGPGLLLILVAVALLVAGVATGSNTLLISSIAVSLLMTVTLFVRARQAAPAVAGAGRTDGGRVPGGGPGRPTRRSPSFRRPAGPPTQRPPADAAETASRAAPCDGVLVVDGLPHYHQPGCRHLGDGAEEWLSMAEAVDLGFTPCGACAPDEKRLGPVAE